jgi:hypothetical protein
MDLGIPGQEFTAQVYDRRGRRRNLQIIQKDGRDPLVHQNAAVLRIIAELHDVKVPVVALQQVRLRPTAHFPDQPSGVDRHRQDAKNPF